MPEEYRTLQPFVSLLERMGALYMQHFGPSKTTERLRTTFDLTYEGSLASANTTKPLFAALIKGMYFYCHYNVPTMATLTPHRTGLLQPITSTQDTNINLINAELIAKERGILVNESRARENVDQEGYSASVTLRARIDPRSPSAGRTPRADPFSEPASRAKKTEDHVISGFVSNNTPYISRLGRFRTSFVPEGTLLIARNYDEPGKIGKVGGILGKAGVNIRFMSVAPIDDGGQDGAKDGAKNSENEALMILGVDRAVDEAVRKELLDQEGVLEAGVVVL